MCVNWFCTCNFLVRTFSVLSFFLVVPPCATSLCGGVNSGSVAMHKGWSLTKQQQQQFDCNFAGERQKRGTCKTFINFFCVKYLHPSAQASLLSSIMLTAKHGRTHSEQLPLCSVPPFVHSLSLLPYVCLLLRSNRPRDKQ